MKFIHLKTFTVITTVLALGIAVSAKNYNVKADAAITSQQGVVVRSTNYTANKVVKVPEKVVQASNQGKNGNDSNGGSSSTLSRGGSGTNVGSTVASESGSKVVSYAYKFIGSPYVWGAAGPRAFDCSGFTMYVYSAFGVGLDHYTGSQFNEGQSVSTSNLTAGDLVFFNTYGSISHVGIYIGDGNFIHAANSNTGVIVSSLSEGYYSSAYAGARRFLK